ncbi:MAG: universal stress protein, partial [Pseudonocardia sp.]|nr:universal stress protein [Pseudonocardia sp.]
AGWRATPVARRTFGGEGRALASMADELGVHVLVVGTRGLAGPGAVLDSVTDQVVHESPRPVLVVPHPMLTDERECAASGPVVAGWDGSAGARAAVCAAAALFASRELIAVTVGPGVEEAVEVADGRRITTVTVPEPLPVPGPGRGTAGALIGAARGRGAGVLVVGSRGRSALREIVLGSTAMATLHRAHLPVLVVPPRVDKVVADTR